MPNTKKPARKITKTVSRGSSSRKVQSSNKNLLMSCFAVVFAALATVLLAFGSAATAQTSFSGTLSKKQPVRTHTISTTVSGSISASVSATKGATPLTLTLKQGSTLITQASGAPATISAPVSSGTFTFEVSASVASPTQYVLNITYPVPDAQPALDTTPPTPPTSLTATLASSSQVNLAWQSATDNVGVASYTVYRNGVALSTSMTTTYSDVNIAPGTTYSYTVTARDAAGNVSVASNNATVTTPTPSDTTPPTVTITSPTVNAIVAGTINVTGTAKDNVGVASVGVAIDTSGSSVLANYNASSATWTYSMNTTLYPDGDHNIFVQAKDSSGNATVMVMRVTVKNSTAPPPTSTAPDTQGNWTSPEGAYITVDTPDTNPKTGKLWTIRDVYILLQTAAAGPGDFSRIAPSLKVHLQNPYNTLTLTSVIGNPGAYTSIQATIWLDADASGFVSSPDMITTHEFGHAWTDFHAYLDHGGSWSTYQNTRWANADGSTKLSQDSRLGSNYGWDTREIIADDYRMLYGNAASISQAPGHLNPYIPDPRNQPGLKSWFDTFWKVKQ